MASSHLITRLSHQADGIADGPIYVPRCLPGETVSGHVDGTRLTDVRIETPSPARVSAPCRHYRSCGGCQLQHAADDFVAGWKVDMVRHALAAQGIETDLRAPLTSPGRSRRRAVLAARRTKKGALVGFYGRASDAITEIEDCHVLSPALMAAVPAVRALAEAGASRKQPLSVTVTESPEGPDIAVRGGKPLDDAMRAALGPMAERHGMARLAWDDEVVALRAPPAQIFGAARVVPPPGAFLQATRHGEAALLQAIREATGPVGRVIDLFAGCGTFSLPMARDAEVLAVEGDAAMIAALDRGWRQATGLKKVTTQTRDLFRRPLMADELRADAVVLDPPRAGAEAQIAEIAGAGVLRIAYVSCNPVTFARDARILLGAGYGLSWVQVVDQFRWSAHTELAAAFALPHMRQD
ncbi:MAG: RsmD family RNA methyltransferase [Rhodobacteraceae bacterium]|nr:RsmD family RNA methyltransferase [Paracoccaceae bacterium]